MTVTTPRRKRIGLRTRFAVLRAGAFRCTYCGRGPRDGAVLEVDHRIPVVAGGTNDRENLVVACQACNNGKGPELLAECFDFAHAGPYQLLPFETGDSALWCLACTRVTHTLGVNGRVEIIA